MDYFMNLFIVHRCNSLTKKEYFKQYMYIYILYINDKDILLKGNILILNKKINKKRREKK